MNVLSLFDGMSCGRIALDRPEIPVKTYYASEVDKYAIAVSEDNYPDIVRLGDVTKWREWDIDWSSIDLLLAGSPCQGFSFAGKQLAFDDPRSALFFVFVDILNHIKSLNPDVKFLLENVKMKKEYLSVISEHVGVEPVFINSVLVSAQNRQRYYWANWEFGQPEDKGIVLADILDIEYTQPNSEGWHTWWKEKSEFQLRKKYSAICNNGTTDKAITMTARQFASWNGDFVEVKRLSDLSRAKGITEDARGYRPNQGDKRKSGLSEVGRICKATGTSNTITTSHSPKIALNDDIDDLVYRKLTPVECERLQCAPDNYTKAVSNTQRYKMLGNGWTVDVIAHILKAAK